MTQVLPFVEGAKIKYQLRIEITDFCDQSCHHCQYSRLFSNSSRFISREILFSAIQQVKLSTDFSDTTVLVTGGEPLLHPDIFSFVDQLYLDGAKHIGLATNALPLINSKNILKKFLDTKFDELIVSLDLDESSYLGIRGSDSQSKLVSLFNWLKENDPALIVTANILIHQGNAKDPQYLFDFIESMPCAAARLIVFNPKASPFSNLQEPSTEQLFKINHLLEQHLIKLNNGFSKKPIWLVDFHKENDKVKNLISILPDGSIRHGL